MKILVVSNLYPPIVFGGYEILCQQVVEELRRNSHEVNVLTSDFRAPETTPAHDVRRQLRLTTNFPLPGEKVGHVEFGLGPMQRIADYNYPMARKAIEDFRPDVVFCWCLSRLSLAPVRAAQRLGVPVCYTINDEHPRQFIPALTSGPVSPRKVLKWVAERWLWPLTTMWGQSFPITLISHALRDRLLQAGLPVAHGRVIHQGIPLDNFPYQPAPPIECTRLLYVGQISKTKGVHTLIASLAQLRGDFRLDVVGDGVPDYQQSLNQDVARLGLQERVHFLGRRPHAEIPQIYRQHDILVFPSEWEEPFGLTHLEAMASGCAVVSTTTGGSAELIRDGLNAVAFRAGDAAHLTSRLQSLLDTPALQQQLHQQARQYIEQYHSLTGYVERLEKFLRATIEDYDQDHPHPPALRG